MSNTEILMERNAQYARSAEEPGDLTSPELKGLMLLTCADRRVDPAYVLGIRPNEALILRNPGGRVTPSIPQSLAVLASVGPAMGVSASELVIMHHTDCGLSYLGPEHSSMLAGYLGVSEDELASKDFADPVASVHSDIDLLRASALDWRSLLVSGLVYDVASRRAELVAPPAQLG
jgi:carbonic anhydrase